MNDPIEATPEAPAAQVTVQTDEKIIAQLKKRTHAVRGVARPGEDEEAQWVIISVHASEDAAREALEDGQMLVNFIWVNPSPFMVAELDREVYPDELYARVDDLYDLEEAEEKRDDVSCPGYGDEPCGHYNDDGEGYDGLCGNCADQQHADDEDEDDDSYSDHSDEDDEDEDV